MRKKSIFAVSAVLIALTIVVGIITAVAHTGDKTAYVSITESVGEEMDGICTLNFDVTSDTLRSVQFVFSYDNTVIVPCAADGTALEISASEQSEVTACFVPAMGFNLLAPEYVVNGTLTTVNLSLSTEADGADFSTKATVCGFTYKVAEGKSKSASSLRLETAELTDSALSGVFPTSTTASPVKIDNASRVFYLSADGETGAVLSEFTFAYDADEASITGNLVTIRADGDTPIVNAESGYSNLATLNIYTSSDKNQLVRSAQLETPDTAVGSIPFSIVVAPGSYYGEILKNGYLPYTVEFTVTPSGASLGDITLSPGDISGSYSEPYGDGVVDIDDFIRVMRGFSEFTEDNTIERLDINEDGTVTVEDLSHVKSALKSVAEQ